MEGNIAEQLDPIFNARAVAVIGASNNPTKWGYSLMERPQKAGYQGALYPVNPNEREVLGLKAYPTILDVPGEVDLAVFTIPARLVPQAVRECIQKGVKGGVVISAGFAETGPGGQALQDELAALARRGGFRFVGPNCNGIGNSATALNLFSPQALKPGAIAFVSQSGAFGGMLARAALAKGYGLSKFISSGNQADLNDADYLEYLGRDPHTKVIALYLEGFRDGRRFMSVAREVAKTKPIVVYKGGRTQVGKRAVRSHTGSMMVEDALFEALCKQVGLIRSYEAIHTFDMAAALASAPLPKGKKIGIMAMTGGQCVITSDTCAYLGLEVPELDQETQARLKEVLAPHAPLPRNPIDFAGDFRSPFTFSTVAETLAQLEYIDGIIASSPPGVMGTGGSPPEIQEKVKAAAHKIATIPKRYGKPLIVVGGLPTSGPAADAFREEGIPAYETPEECARGMLALAKYWEILSGA